MPIMNAESCISMDHGFPIVMCGNDAATAVHHWRLPVQARQNTIFSLMLPFAYSARRHRTAVMPSFHRVNSSAGAESRRPGTIFALRGAAAFGCPMPSAADQSVPLINGMQRDGGRCRSKRAQNPT